MSISQLTTSSLLKYNESTINDTINTFEDLKKVYCNMLRTDIY